MIHRLLQRFPHGGRVGCEREGVGGLDAAGDRRDLTCIGVLDFEHDLRRCGIAAPMHMRPVAQKAHAAGPVAHKSGDRTGEGEVNCVYDAALPRPIGPVDDKRLGTKS